MEKVNQALSEVGLITTVVPTLLDFREVITAKGNTEKLVTVQVEVTIYDVESGMSVVFSGIGSGQDSGDKAVMKAETAAIKYAYLLSLCIATGDDPEADRSVDEATTSEPTTPTTHSTPPQRKPPTKQTAPTSHTLESPNHVLSCTDCGIPILAKVNTYSQNKFGQSLCMNCQKLHSQNA